MRTSCPLIMHLRRHVLLVSVSGILLAVVPVIILVPKLFPSRICESNVLICQFCPSVPWIGTIVWSAKEYNQADWLVAIYRLLLNALTPYTIPNDCELRSGIRME